MGHTGDHEGLFRPHGEGSSPSIPLQTGSGFHAMISVSFRINTSEDFLLEVQLRGPARLAAGLLRGLELCPGGAGLQEPWTISGNWGRTCGLGRVEGGWVREGLLETLPATIRVLRKWQEVILVMPQPVSLLWASLLFNKI